MSNQEKFKPLPENIQKILMRLREEFSLRSINLNYADLRFPLQSIDDHLVMQNLQYLLLKISEFIPARAEIIISSKILDENEIIEVINTGIDLSRYRDLISSITLPIWMQSSTEFEGTIFQLELLPEESRFNTNHKTVISPYYADIKSRLASHFSLPPDDSFLNNEPSFQEKLHQVIREHLEDETFNVKAFAKLMNLSVPQLFRKIKDLTGLSPGRYLTMYRLKLAKNILKSSNHTISEVAYSLGFKSPSHFTRAYKKLFGHNPSIEKNKVQSL